MSDSTKEPWLQWLALATVVLAVCASIASLKAGSYSTKATLTTTDENNQWAYFQAKSIKQHTCEVQRDLLTYYRSEARTATAQQNLDKLLARCGQDIARYDQEKNEIKAGAEKRAKDEDVFKRKGASMSLAVMLLQIAIMLSSVSALLKRSWLWGAGLAVGLTGLVYMVNAFALVR
ncbi:MAG: DUF4337 domain-containing protein [Armatimonadetes bacterium]|nr:DUF4337 domain-containing protein [Armatimonadota bacterium]